jgi:hypothetical protein
MSLLTYKDRVKQAISAGGTGTITLGAAPSGYQALAAGDNAKYFPYVLDDSGAWETGYGLYTSSGTTFARTLRTDSSTGGAINVTTAGFFYVDADAFNVQEFEIAQESNTPGGRLTLTTNVPVTSADVTGATNIYYTPYIHDGIALWDGVRWKRISFSQVTTAIGTVSAGIPQDVFGFLSGGALAVEFLVWTNASARATGLTLGDGRYYKTGDQTRLYLGTWYPSSSTTCEDSCGGVTTQVGGKRFLWNNYNRRLRNIAVIDTQTAGYTYASTTIRQTNAASGNKFEFVIGLAEDMVDIAARTGVYQSATGAYAGTGVGIDTTSAYSGKISGALYNSGSAGAIYYQAFGHYKEIPAVGYHAANWNESGNSGSPTFYGSNGSSPSVQVGGLLGEIWA